MHLSQYRRPLHSCSNGLVLPEPYLKVFEELARSYPNFYADTSALTLPNRVRALFFLCRHPELHDRLIFGTDYPLPVFSYPSLGRSYKKVTRAKSPFDRHALVTSEMKNLCTGFPGTQGLDP